MKTQFYALAAAMLLAAPISSFAQGQAAFTRAQVRDQLVELERAGYNPVSTRLDYPQNLAAAQAKVAAQNGTAELSGYGTASTGCSQAGAPTERSTTGL
jgi:hypothetical protein